MDTMKTISAFSRYLLFWDHHHHHRYSKTYENSRPSHTGFDSMDSNASTRPAYLDKPAQLIYAHNVSDKKLINLLNFKFGSSYRLETISDIYHLYADSRLTEAEIMSCMYSTGAAQQ
ncbi:hypothetical protein F5B22DRAFT_595583 [Xylaria bambusicola]|uniref:uncharacterized protein n=1 Tax=Xylaria bambusicola TaxID=326684 RepID=UPI00200777B6|nr:uncharacterized protein F5B22DRAFT_595583 [Xylaria bambusicola]KAI0521590.1 hypothetical protein F5B22DRAFT_595583 [Xylaria bambusicola]